jgi:hypothetical protein
MITSLALLLPAALPADGFQLANNPLVGYSKRVANATTAYAEITGEPGAPFVLFAHAAGQPFELGTAFPVFGGMLSPLGHISAAMAVPGAHNLPAGTVVGVTAVFLHNGQLFQTGSSQIPIGAASDVQCVDFDFAPGFSEPQKGEQITNQYASFGLNVAAFNGASGPDKAIIFNSDEPTGGDFDLATPGYGTGNDQALGKLLIIAENDFDGDANGEVDEPDDERFGGTLRFDFDDPTFIASAKLVDIDDLAPSSLEFTIDGVPGTTIVPVIDVGDNGIQEVFVGLDNVTRMDLILGGSGAIAELCLVPCPITVDFDETTTGMPLDLPAGTQITNQFNDVGLSISALAGLAGLPNKAIIFDSGNPTGGDPDLGTPGPGIGNDTFLGNLLILAENDNDVDMDGLVDDPDDSAVGGQIFLNWDRDVTFFSMTIIDVDSPEIDGLALFDEFNNQLLAFDFGPIGDNSVQTFSSMAGIQNVRRAVVLFSGSGGIDNFRFCPEEDDPTTSIP